jgi:hypothetical protein
MARGDASPLNNIDAEPLWAYDGELSVGWEWTKPLQQVGCPPDWQGVRCGSEAVAS